MLHLGLKSTSNKIIIRSTTPFTSKIHSITFIITEKNDLFLSKEIILGNHGKVIQSKKSMDVKNVWLQIKDLISFVANTV